MRAHHGWIVAVALAGLATAGCGRGGESSPAPAALPAPRVRPPVRFAAAPALTAAQLAAKAQLEAQLRAEQPTHRLVLANGRQVECQVLEETADRLRVREGFGYSGHLTSTYQRREVRRVEPLPAAACTVTATDLALCAEFPGFHFSKSAPYSFVTDESYGEVRKAIGLLGELRAQFEREFGELIEPARRPATIQVVFFSDETRFRAYARRVAPSFAAGAGFYSAGEDRLVLFNQLGSDTYQQLQQQVAGHQRLARLADRDDARVRLVAAQAAVTVEAKTMTEQLLRHEGAHQLFHGYRIDSGTGVEPLWLVEGLAQYCEPAQLGGWHGPLAERLHAFQRAGRLLAWRELLDYQASAGGFLARGRPFAEVAYAQSWGLVHMLRTGAHREGLTALMRLYRDLGDDEAVAARLPSELFCQTIGVTPQQLDAEWQAYLRRL